MYVKFQHSDANRVHVLCSSIKTQPVNLEKHNNGHKYQYQVLEKTPTGAVKKFVRIHKQPKPTHGRKTGTPLVLVNTDSNRNGFAGDANGGKVSKPTFNGLIEHKRDSGEKFSSGKASVAAAVKVHTRCSTKWTRYSGCIPAILEALETSTDLDDALMPWEKSLNNKARSIILKEQSNWERAWQIFEWFKNQNCYELNVIHYNIVIRILGRSCRWNEIDKLWNEMREKGIAPVNSTYGTLIDVYSKGGLKNKAMEWLNLMNKQGMVPDEVTMGTVVQLYKKSGQFEEAEAFFKTWSSNGKKLDSGDYGSSHSLSSHTYNTLIDTYGKSGQLKEASETLEKMLKEGVQPTTVTFNTMIHICGNQGLMDEVNSLIQIMEKIGCFPDTRTYNILISLHAKNDDIETAASYFRKMKEASLEPDPVSYRTLLYAFSIRRMVGEAEELVCEMTKKGLEMDEFTQSALTRMYIEAGLLEKAWLWFEQFHLRGNMSSECYTANIDAFGERGHVLEAEKVFRCCRTVNKLTVLEFNVMIKAYGMNGKFEEACSLFDDMEKHDLRPDLCSYTSLIRPLAGADLPHKAMFYVRKMQKAGLLDNCFPYSVVISSFVNLGQLEMAVSVYEEMIELNIKPDVIFYVVLINAFIEIGDVQRAIGYTDKMVKSGLQLNAVIYNLLIKLYTKFGYLEEAREAYRMLRSFDVEPDEFTSNCMLDLYSERSMFGEAEEIFEHMKKKGAANEFSYAMMLRMYKRNWRFVEGDRIAREMRELGILKDLLSYNNIIGLFVCDSRFKDAFAVFKDMIRSGVQPDECTFNSLGFILLKRGVPKEAIGEISGVEKWVSALSSVVCLDGNDDLNDEWR